ncbi:RHS repeat-associated protein [Sinobacterium caligoides]|uniref:RHS repeat-associated protein n=1 Tax=Sinobacterium caligoides TaxID=933926 RepID=A0A3N2DZ45_9GAMM|nr:RHS repeat-associated core domain-containing protein [Sinobacterium caligoides]ROS05084.1 RHS repeat-associated protein [Sinobacterium caligoides]
MWKNQRIRSFLAGLSASVLGVLTPALASAATGIEVQTSTPHYATAAYEDTFTDLRVKVLGGEVRMTRRWMGDHWEWNRRWTPLQLFTSYGERIDHIPTEAEAVDGKVLIRDIFQQSEIDHGDKTITPDEVKALLQSLLRNGQNYLRKSSGEDPLFANLPQRTITAHQGGAEGFSWSDRLGNRISYDNHGRMTGYADPYGVQVTLIYDAEGRIEFIEDHHGKTVISYGYDAQGRLKRVTDYQGREVVYNYNASNQLQTVTDVRGETWTYHYKGELLVGYSDPKQNKTTLVLDKEGRLSERFNADGVGIRVDTSFDEKTQRYYLAVTDGEGTLTETWYNTLGQAMRKAINGEQQFSASLVMSDGSSNTGGLSKRYRINRPGGGLSLGSSSQSSIADDPYVKQRIVTDPRGNRTTYEYDQFGKVKKKTLADGSTVQTDYNNRSQVTKRTDERGVITAYTYWPNSRLKTLTEAQGRDEERVTSYSYDEFGQLKVTTYHGDANTEQAVEQFDYDDYGNIKSYTDALEQQTQYQDFDALGNARVLIDARGKQWARSFDNAGNLLTDLNPYGQGTRLTYDKSGYIATITDAAGVTTTVATNASGMPLTLTDANNKVTTLSYNKRGQLLGQEDAEQHGNALRYDALGRLKQQIDGMGNSAENHYKDGQLDSVSYPGYSEGKGVKESYQYDKRLRRKAVTQQFEGGSLQRQFGYKQGQQLEKYTDANDNVTGYVYDGLDRMIASTDAEAGTTEFSYDDRDNLLTVTDPEGRITRYTYTLRDELSSESKQWGGNDSLPASAPPARQYFYDHAGNLSDTINAKGERSHYIYDDASRLRTVMTGVVAEAAAEDSGGVWPTLPPVASAAETIQLHYNDKGQYQGYSDGTSSELITYNALGQRQTVTVTYPGNIEKTYRYDYYANGLKKSYTGPEQQQYGYQYNRNSQLTAVTIPGQGQISWSDFHWQRPQRQTLPGGSYIAYGYDGLQRERQRSVYDASGQPLATALYGFDAESNIKRIDTETTNKVYDYDNLYRLIEESNSAISDAPATSLAPNQFFDYDGVGNRIAAGTDQASLATWGYNGLNQLLATPQTSYSYDDNGHTTRKITGGVVTEYVYNSQERLVEVKVDGVSKATYGYNPYGQRIRKTVGGTTTWFFYSDEGMIGEYDATGALVKEYHFKPYSPWMTEPLLQRDAATNQVYYYHNDHLGTPQQLLAKSGAVVWSAVYSAFGEATLTTATVSNNLRFPGQYYDAESGLHYNMFRDYDPSTGRYVQEDPIGLEGGGNVYGYVKNTPLNDIDSLGLRFMSRWNRFQQKNPGYTSTQNKIRYRRYNLNRWGNPGRANKDALEALPDNTGFIREKFKESGGGGACGLIFGCSLPWNEVEVCHCFIIPQYKDAIQVCPKPEVAPSDQEMSEPGKEVCNCFIERRPDYSRY